MATYLGVSAASQAGQFSGGLPGPDGVTKTEPRGGKDFAFEQCPIAQRFVRALRQAGPHFSERVVSAAAAPADVQPDQTGQ